MKVVSLEDHEIALLTSMLEERANLIFQMRVAESKKGKNKDERYGKQLLEESLRIEHLLKKLQSP
jgi:hypothetical protein